MPHTWEIMMDLSIKFDEKERRPSSHKSHKEYRKLYNKYWVDSEKLQKRIKWLKQEIVDLYHKVGKFNADMCEDDVLKKIDNALGVYEFDEDDKKSVKFISVEFALKQISEEIKPRIIDILNSKDWDVHDIEQFVNDVLSATLAKLKSGEIIDG